MCDFCNEKVYEPLPVIEHDANFGILGFSRIGMYIRHYNKQAFFSFAFDNYGLGGKTLHKVQEIHYCPFSAIGAIPLLYITNSKINMTSLMGFLMLAGIVVNNGILLIDTANRNRKTMAIEHALVQAGKSRLRPILMTTMTTILTFFLLPAFYMMSNRRRSFDKRDFKIHNRDR